MIYGLLIISYFQVVNGIIYKQSVAKSGLNRGDDAMSIVLQVLGKAIVNIMNDLSSNLVIIHGRPVHEFNNQPNNDVTMCLTTPGMMTLL